MMPDYAQFLASKRPVVEPSGFDVAPEAINPKLFRFQADCVRWALQLGKAALFEERGLGKTLQELEWATHVAAYTGKPVLILAPLAVAKQTLREAAKFGYDLTYCGSQVDVGDHAVVISNYERLHGFDLSRFGGLVADESSILKSFTGKTKRALLAAGAQVPFVLAASATPAPNDHLELGNHAEFLGVMPSNEMIARWFINNSMKAGDYRLKKHAERDFWRWLTSWGVCISHPRDLGPDYDQPGYDLPPLRLVEYRLKASDAAYERARESGKLLPDERPSSAGLHLVKRESLADRVAQALSIASALPADEPLIVWCDTNYESDALKEAFPDALEVRGSHSPKLKEERLIAFTDGESRQIITKPDIAGLGLNWQHCGEQIFAGLTFSFEKFYQAIGRSHRFGRDGDVTAHLIYAETEGGVLTTIQHKQAQFAEMQAAMTDAMREHGLFRDGIRRGLLTSFGTRPMIVPSWLHSKGAA